MRPSGGKLTYRLLGELYCRPRLYQARRDCTVPNTVEPLVEDTPPALLERAQGLPRRQGLGTGRIAPILATILPPLRWSA